MYRVEFFKRKDLEKGINDMRNEGYTFSSITYTKGDEFAVVFIKSMNI